MERSSIIRSSALIFSEQRYVFECLETTWSVFLHSWGANEQANRPKRRSPLSIDTRNPKRDINAFLAFWEGIGYLMKGDRVGRRKRGVSHHSLDEMEQRKLLLNILIP
ncbi:hypothetical protein EVAR_40590_1 [Eumeta japonica]|uniref:Uncharacterized protein n=1 Tax=Eumeta variegata TaxID=151549 RepID=A0A4C1VX31_EUMVA|nr:hypothetical protein EVAR_40590_1 [Eumeta japonica]